jgi:uncharacterized protein YndB with AHSA1/START domain
MKITIESTIPAPIEEVWRVFTTPNEIKQWNAASEDWHCPAAEIDLRVGGRFSHRMEAKDGSEGFDFAGTFTKVVPNDVIEYTMDDGRSVAVAFVAGERGVTVRTTFDAESVYPVEVQRQGWQAILNNFAQHVQGRQ